MGLLLTSWQEFDCLPALPVGQALHRDIVAFARCWRLCSAAMVCLSKLQLATAHPAGSYQYRMLYNSLQKPLYLFMVDRSSCRYFVRTCKRPQERAALALAVRVGSAVERDEEQGVAHIVEHLAFNATEARRVR